MISININAEVVKRIFLEQQQSASEVKIDNLFVMIVIKRIKAVVVDAREFCLVKQAVPMIKVSICIIMVG
ncbi:MAG: hypothetical protein NY202_05105 [Mollicutes bacterium UO1]